MSLSNPDASRVSRPVFRSRTNRLELSRSRRMKAIRVPSGDGVGRTAPPGAEIALETSPVVRLIRSIANSSVLLSCAYSKIGPGDALRVK